MVIMAQPAVLPPSTVRICPVMKEALSDARNTTACAISSGSRLEGVVVANESVEHSGLDRSGCDRVDADARRGALQGGRLGEPFDGMLARGIDGGAGPPKFPEGGGNIDDAAAFLGQHHPKLMLQSE